MRTPPHVRVAPRAAREKPPLTDGDALTRFASLPPAKDQDVEPIFAVATFALVLTSCSEEKKGAAFASCRTDDDCHDELFCAQGGAIINHCARSCESDAECEVRYGVGHQCHDSVCVQVCGYTERCDDAPARLPRAATV